MDFEQTLLFDFFDVFCWARFIAGTWPSSTPTCLAFIGSRSPTARVEPADWILSEGSGISTINKNDGYVYTYYVISYKYYVRDRIYTRLEYPGFLTYFGLYFLRVVHSWLVPNGAQSLRPGDHLTWFDFSTFSISKLSWVLSTLGCKQGSYDSV